MYAPSAASADELDSMVDHARLEESSYVLLDGLDAPWEGDYERVLDRPRNRSRKRCERRSLERRGQDEGHKPWCFSVEQGFDRLYAQNM